jgi:TolB-like protein
MLFAAGRFREPSSSADSSRVLVAAFANRTGDSTLDYVGYIAADWITQGLSQSEFAKVVYGPTAYELSRSARNGAAASEAEKIRLLSARSGAGTVIDGSYYLVHDSIVISAQVTDGRSARVLRIVPPIAAPRSDPMSAVRVLRQRSVGALATVLDRRLSSLSNLSSPPPLEEAYRQYLEGLELFGRKGTNPRSLERFLSAAQLDSSFMLPLIWAHMMASNAGNIRVRDSVLRVLQAHRTQLAPIDRYALEFMEVIVDSTSEARRKIAAGSRVSALAPASNWSVVQAGILLGAGFAPEALELLQQVDAEHSWAGAWSAYWEILMDTQHRLGDYKAELRTAQRAARVGLEAGNLTLGRLGAIRALIALGRVDTAMTLVRDGDPSLNDYFRLRFLASAARELRSHRRAGPSDSLYQVVLDWFRTGRDGPAMRRNADYIYYALQAGALDEAKDVAEAILADHPDDLAAMRAHAALGVFAARKGDRAGALSHMQQMPDSGTHRVAFRWAAAELKALVAGALHDRELAIRYLVELEAQGRAREPDAAMLTEWYTDLSWLANEPRIRKPRAGRTP